MTFKRLDMRGVSCNRNSTLAQLSSVLTVLTLFFIYSKCWPGEARPPTRPRARAEYAEYCRKALAHPKPHTRECQRPKNDPLCKDRSALLMAHALQDYYLYTRHFTFLRRPGVYLDVAANEPMRGSNTFFFDACLGWRGLCVEANPLYHEWLRGQRGCDVEPTCVSDKDGDTVSFYARKRWGGIVDTNKNIKDGEVREDVEMLELNCTTMRAALDKRGISKVDYLSLDVEGHEMKVLQGVDWDKVVFNVMTVEVTPETRQNIQSFLEGKGYVLHELDPDAKMQFPGLMRRDVVFLHKSVTFGHPE